MWRLQWNIGIAPWTCLFFKWLSGITRAPDVWVFQAGWISWSVFVWKRVIYKGVLWCTYNKRKYKVLTRVKNLSTLWLIYALWFASVTEGYFLIVVCKKCSSQKLHLHNNESRNFLRWINRRSSQSNFIHTQPTYSNKMSNQTFPVLQFSWVDLY